jgi:FKBP-type peptidyl-prolyl cis-trans isomerase SlyD
MSLVIGANHVVSLRYTLTVSGDTIESGEINYLHGHGNIVPGLEAGLEGAGVGEARDVAVPPGLGYGERHEDAMQSVPRTMFPPDMEIAPGMRFLAASPDGERIPVYVMHVDAETVVVDANHPLAGATLNFDVTITAIRAATAEEIAHGHPHGADGHDHSHGH